VHATGFAGGCGAGWGVGEVWGRLAGTVVSGGGAGPQAGCGGRGVRRRSTVCSAALGRTGGLLLVAAALGVPVFVPGEPQAVSQIAPITIAIPPASAPVGSCPSTTSPISVAVAGSSASITAKRGRVSRRIAICSSE
jgi:hypothetical protein